MENDLEFPIDSNPTERKRALRKRTRVLSDDEGGISSIDPPLEKKSWLVCIGMDKMAFQVRIDHKKSFPPDDPCVPTLSERFNLKAGQSFSLYWNDNSKPSGTGSRQLINVIFKAFAPNYEAGFKLVKMLSTQIVQKISLKNSDRSSVATSSFIRDIDFNDRFSSRSESEEDFDKERSFEIYNNSNALQELQTKMFESRFKADKLNQAVQSKSSKSVASDSATLRESNILVLLQSTFDKIDSANKKLDHLSTSLNNLESRVDGIKDNVQDGFDELLNHVKNVEKNVGSIQKNLLKKESLVACVVKDKQLFGDSETLLWLVEKKYICEIANKAYRNTNEPKEFIVQLVQDMYGDLISFFKYKVVRQYTDGKGTTRPALESFDPTEKRIIHDCIEKYFIKHEEQVKINGTLASWKDFESHCIEHIDCYSLRTNVKKGLKYPCSKIAKFYTYVVEEKCKPRKDFTEYNRNEVARLYDEIGVKKPTHKELKKAETSARKSAATDAAA